MQPVVLSCETIEDKIRNLCRQLLAAQNEEALLRVIPQFRYALGELESELSLDRAAVLI